MAESIFNLKPAPTEADAERLVEAVERVMGVTDATVDTATQRLFVTFDTMRTGDIAIENVLKNEGFAVASEDEVDLDTDAPGFTTEAERLEQNQAIATGMTRDQEIDLGGGLGAESM